MTKQDNKNFENFTKCWVCDNSYVDGNIKVGYHCHITGKHRGSSHRDCNIDVQLNHQIPIIFHNLKNYDCHLFMQGLMPLNLKINVILNKLENYMSSSINNKLSAIDRLNFLSCLLYSLVK